ncbi:MAG: T9SS type A sorting domain-containing protein [Cryomorphaceae bacterium]|nr:T9SS type A sorting domain-containing protein [Cryomorphaceae bacterium]
MRYSILPFILFFCGCTADVEQSAFHRKMEPADNLWVQRSWPDLSPDVRIMSALQEQLAAEQNNRSNDTPWRLDGPTNIGGRLNVITLHPDNEEVIFVGASSGGIFKSDDNGQNWIPIADSFEHLAIADIVFAPSNANVLYVGTGDPNISGTPHPGNGVYKSTDGGETWTNIGLSEGSIVSKIVVHPSNPDIVYVGMMGLPFERNNDRGLYKTTDGGDTWEQVLFLSDEAGITDLRINPENPDIVYAAGWNRIRNNQESLVTGDFARVFKTIDGGENWEMLTGGLPETPQSRIGLEMSATNPNRLWAIVVGESFEVEGLYRTDDAGDTWTNIIANPFDLEGILGGFGWYFGKVCVNPFDDNEVSILGVDMWTSFDNGQTWEMTVPPWYFYEVHADKHDMVYAPSGNILLATDGGLYRTENHFASWDDIDDIPNTQFYKVAIDPFQSEVYTGGAQDNGTTTGNHTNLDDWSRDYGGDGFQCIYDPFDSELFYMETQYGNIVYSYNGFVDQFTFGIEEDDRRNWSMPYVMSNFDNAEFITGTYRVYHMSDAPFGFWEPISFDLTDGNIYGSTFHNISAVEIDKYSGQTFYAGTTDGNVWRGNAGGVWINITSGLPDRYVTSINTSKDSPQHVWVSHSGYKDNDNTAHLHLSTNGGTTWIDVTGDLPEQPINHVEVLNDTIFFIATDFGVYHTINGGENWERIGNNMPRIPVFDLEVDTTNHRLVAGTFARSIWSFPTDSIFTWPEDSGIYVDNPKKNRLTIYPNPVNDRLHISGIEQCDIEVYSMSGQKVLAVGNVTANRPINVSMLNSGKYVMLVSRNGRRESLSFIKW